MGNATEHGELRLFAQPEPLAHPGEEVRQTVMPTLDALRDSCTPTREGQGTDTVRTNDDVGVSVTEVAVRLQHINAF